MFGKNDSGGKNWKVSARKTILAGFIFIAEKVVAAEMWEPALCASFQVPGLRLGISGVGITTDPRRVILTAKARISPHFRQKRPWNT